jgi:hypothetical protein
MQKIRSMPRIFLPGQMKTSIKTVTEENVIHICLENVEMSYSTHFWEGKMEKNNLT